MSYYAAEYGERRRGRGGRNRGRGRGGGHAPDWFLHDDREEEFQDGGCHDVEPQPAPVEEDITVRVDQRGSRVVQDRSAPGSGNLLVSVSGQGQGRRRKVIVESGQEGWEYRDREGDAHGPFAASRILKWMERGYFSGELRIRRVAGPQGGPTSYWTSLTQVLEEIRQEAAAEAAPAVPAPRRQAQGPGGAAPQYAPVPVGGGGRGYGRGPPPENHGGSYEVYSPHGGDGFEPAPGGGRRGRGRGGPPREREEFRGRGGYAGYGEEQGPESYGGRGRGRGRERGGRGGRGEGRGGGRGRDGGRGGRGGRAMGPDPAIKEAVQRLFAGEAKQGAEQPMWRYIDPDGHMQGPFPAQNMIEWHGAGYLHDMKLPVCGTERKVSPPNLPTPAFFVPLGVLLDYVRAGNKFEAVRVEDVRSGVVPAYLEKLTSPAQPRAASAAAKAAGGKKGAADHAAKSPQELAAGLVAGAIRKALVACGEAPVEDAPAPAAPAAATAAAGTEDEDKLAVDLAAAAVEAVLLAYGEAPAAALVAEPQQESAAVQQAQRQPEQEGKAGDEAGAEAGEEAAVAPHPDSKLGATEQAAVAAAAGGDEKKEEEGSVEAEPADEDFDIEHDEGELVVDEEDGADLGAAPGIGADAAEAAAQAGPAGQPAGEGGEAQVEGVGSAEQEQQAERPQGADAAEEGGEEEEEEEFQDANEEESVEGPGESAAAGGEAQG